MTERHLDSPADLLALAPELLGPERSVPGRSILFFGRPGRGKSTLARELVRAANRTAREVAILHADPGQPWGAPPATFSLVRFGPEARVEDRPPTSLAFVGSTDPMAVRLTALGEVLRLVRELRAVAPGAPLVLDACGLVATALGREWALRQAEAIQASHVVLVERARKDGEGEGETGHETGDRGELEALAELFRGRPGLELIRVRAAPEATPGGTSARRRHRGEALESWLARGATRQTVSLASLPVLGAPERGVAPADWKDRLVGLLDASGRTLTVGRVLEGTDDALSLLAPVAPGPVAALRVGDAAWDEATRTVTRRPFAERERPKSQGAFSVREKPQVHVPPFSAPGDERSKRAPGFQVHLANGLFGDPLVHLRPVRERDAVLFDLGRASSLPTKVLHRVGLVLLSHAHMDHFFGFDELLRSLLGTPREVSFVGPPGTAERIASRIGGYTWNLIEDRPSEPGTGRAISGLERRPPRFRITELRGDAAHGFALVPGRPLEDLGSRPAPDGLVHEARTFTVRATALAHRDIASLAYLVTERPRLAVRPEAVAARGLSPGVWLDRLKHAVAGQELEGTVDVGDGRRLPVRELARDLLLEREGQRVAYVTDSADIPSNRARIVGLARGVDLLICEATFTREDEDRARETAHLPAFAAAELAREAGVGRLLPFHLSPRYEDSPEQIFRELLGIFPRVQVPREIAERLALPPRDPDDLAPIEDEPGDA